MLSHGEMIELIGKMSRQDDSRPSTAIVFAIDDRLVDIAIGRSIIRSVRVIGDPSNLTIGQEVQITWKRESGGTARPVVMVNSAGGDGTPSFSTSLREDGVTIENTADGLSVKKGSVTPSHLSFTPATLNHTHKDSLTAYGWEIAPDGSLLASGIAINPLGQISLGLSPDIIKLDSVHPDYRLWAGDTDPSLADFSLSKTGAIKSSSGTIGGWEITEEGLFSGDGSAAIVPGDYPYISLGDADDFMDGIGVWLGRHIADDIYKIHIGDPDHDHMFWDGYELHITGMVSAASSNLGGTISNTWTINTDLDDADIQLIFGRDTGGNATISWDGERIYLDQLTQIGDDIGASWYDLAINKVERDPRFFIGSMSVGISGSVTPTGGTAVDTLVGGGVAWGTFEGYETVFNTANNEAGVVVTKWEDGNPNNLAFSTYAGRRIPSGEWAPEGAMISGMKIRVLYGIGFNAAAMRMPKIFVFDDPDWVPLVNSFAYEQPDPATVPNWEDVTIYGGTCEGVFYSPWYLFSGEALNAGDLLVGMAFEQAPCLAPYEAAEGVDLIEVTFYYTFTYGSGWTVSYNLANEWLEFSPGWAMLNYGAMRLKVTEDSGYFTDFLFNGSKPRFSQQIVSILDEEGTSPFLVSSSVLNEDLNADLLDGEHADAFADAIHGHAWSDITETPTTLSGYGIEDLLVSGDGVITLAAAEDQELTISASGSVVVGSGTIGILPFWDTENSLADTGLYWDSVNGWLGIGAAPTSTLSVVGNSTFSAADDQVVATYIAYTGQLLNIVEHLDASETLLSGVDAEGRLFAPIGELPGFYFLGDASTGFSSDGLGSLSVSVDGNSILGLSENLIVIGSGGDLTIAGIPASGPDANGTDIIFDASTGTGQGNTGEFIWRLGDPPTGGGSVEFDAASYSARLSNVTTNLAWSHTVVEGNILLVCVSCTIWLPRTLSTITYGAQPLTKISTKNFDNMAQVDLWYLLAPEAGEHTITVTYADATIPAGTAISLSGVNQDEPFGEVFELGAYSHLASLSVETDNQDGLYVGALGRRREPYTPTATNQTERALVKTNYDWDPGSGVWSMLSTKVPTGASETLDWTFEATGGHHAIIGICVFPGISNTSPQELSEKAKIDGDGFWNLATNTVRTKDYTGTLPADGTFVMGEGAENRLAFWSGANAVTYSDNLQYDPTTFNLSHTGDDLSAVYFLATYADAGNSQQLFQRARGTVAAPSAVLSGDTLGTLGFRGYHSGGAFTGSSRVALLARTTEDWTATAQGTEILLSTTATGGTTTTAKLYIGPSYVGIGRTETYSVLTISHITDPTVTIARYDTNVASGERIGQIQFWGIDTQLTTQNVFASIDVTASQNISTDAAAGEFTISVTGTTAGGSPLEHIKFKPGAAAMIGLFGATPVAQATTGGASSTVVQNSGNAINDATTFDGYTMAQIVKALRNLGALA